MRLSYALLLVAIGGLLLASVPLTVQEAALSSYNDGSDGTAHLHDAQRTGLLFPQLTVDGVPVRLLHGPLQDLDPEGEAVLILGPERTYASAEINHLSAFLSQGGRALIAEDTGLGRELVADLELGIQIPGIPYYTPAYAKQPSFPIALSTGVLPGLPPETVMNEPSVVEGNGTPVLVTPEVSWLDANTNGRPDLDEERGPFSVAQLATRGQGQVLVLGDPSIFTRGMAGQDAATVQALLAWLTEDRETLVVDEGHRAQGDPIGTAHLLGAGLGPGGTTLLVLGAVALTLVATFRVRLTRAKRQDRFGEKEPKGMSAIERAVIEELEALR